MDDARDVGSPAIPIAGNNRAPSLLPVRALCAAAMISFALLLLFRGQAR
jgi:hypothetical protein